MKKVNQGIISLDNVALTIDETYGNMKIIDKWLN